MRSTDAWAEAVCQPTVRSPNNRTRALAFMLASSTAMFSNAAILRASRRYGKSGTTQYNGSGRSQGICTHGSKGMGRRRRKTAASGAGRQQAEYFAQALADWLQIGRG